MFQIISPSDSSIIKTIPFHTQADVDATVLAAKAAQKLWKAVPLCEKKTIIASFVEHLVSDKEDIATELCQLIGRPRQQNFNEVNGLAFRAKELLNICDVALEDTVVEESTEFSRFMTREALGVILSNQSSNDSYISMELSLPCFW